MRIVFAGTPEPALPSLRRLIASPRHDVVAVLTRPDAAAGRRAKPSPSPVAQLALEHDIPVLRPPRPNSDEFVAELGELAPEACAVVAYGALLGDGLLAVPEHGWINLHFSLLPAWRGAAPVQAAIAAGDTVTGATTFQIEPALDSGPVYGVVTETIRPTDTAGDLLDRLSISGAALLETTLDGIADGTLSPVPQPSDGVTVAPKVTVDDARVRWDLPAHVVDRRIRAVTPNPGAWTLVGDLRIKLGPVSVDDAAPEPVVPWSNSCGPQRRSDRDGVAAGAAGTRPAAGQEADGCGGLGARSPARRVRAGVVTKPRRPRRKPLDPARRAAFDVLRAVTERDAYANLALPALLRERGITGRDAAFATELAYGTCRTRGLLDAVIARAAGRPPENINSVLLDLLRLGTYQLLRTRVDAHAAVSTTVEQAGIEFDSARAGFVNGVLRTIALRDEQSWTDGASTIRRLRPRWPPRVRACPSALDRPGVRRRTRRRRGRAGCTAGRRRRAAACSSGGAARGADGG